MARARHHNCGIMSFAARLGRLDFNPVGSTQESSIIGARTSTSWRTWMIYLLVAGPPSELEWVQDEIKKIHEIQGEMLKHGGMVKFLGREIWLTQGGVTWASDPKHAQLLIDVRGLHVANGTDVPLRPDDRPETKEPMSVNEAKFYRRRAAKLNYMDRPSLCVAANMLSQSRVTRSSSNASVDTCENTQHVSFNTHGKLFLVPWLCAQTAIGPVAGRRGAVRVAWQCFWVKISCFLRVVFKRAWR